MSYCHRIMPEEARDFAMLVEKFNKAVADPQALDSLSKEMASEILTQYADDQQEAAEYIKWALEWLLDSSKFMCQRKYKRPAAGRPKEDSFAQDLTFSTIFRRHSKGEPLKGLLYEFYEMEKKKRGKKMVTEGRFRVKYTEWQEKYVNYLKEGIDYEFRYCMEQQVDLLKQRTNKILSIAEYVSSLSEDERRSIIHEIIASHTENIYDEKTKKLLVNGWPINNRLEKKITDYVLKGYGTSPVYIEDDSHADQPTRRMKRHRR